MNGLAVPSLDQLCSPCCRAPLTREIATPAVTCSICRAIFPTDADTGVIAFSAHHADGAVKNDIQKWWGDLYTQIYQDYDRAMTAESLDADLDNLEAMFRRRRHMAMIEMGAIELAGKRVLEIGSGAGAHSCLFKRRGADVTAVDLTPARALSSARKLALTRGAGSARAYQADAENLPFRDAIFDVVYSNGVLHHSEDTTRCIAEVGRVLKPGGRAIIMLYARHSANYWLSIVPRGILTGGIFRRPEAEWVGQVTEGTPRFGTTRNPITRVYSARALRELFRDFTIESLRKFSFQFDNFCVPRLTQIRDWILKSLGHKPYRGAGMLVYGKPFYAETDFELALAPVLGWGWAIVARKEPSP
jgi:ubiquinone/menaquinone biosynthesis C-methylase UbiE